MTPFKNYSYNYHFNYRAWCEWAGCKGEEKFPKQNPRKFPKILGSFRKCSALL